MTQQSSLMLQWLQNESVARVIISRFCKEITEMKLQNIKFKGKVAFAKNSD